MLAIDSQQSRARYWLKCVRVCVYVVLNTKTLTACWHKLSGQIPLVVIYYDPVVPDIIRIFNNSWGKTHTYAKCWLTGIHRKEWESSTLLVLAHRLLQPVVSTYCYLLCLSYYLILLQSCCVTAYANTSSYLNDWTGNLPITSKMTYTTVLINTTIAVTDVLELCHALAVWLAFGNKITRFGLFTWTAWLG